MGLLLGPRTGGVGQRGGVVWGLPWGAEQEPGLVLKPAGGPGKSINLSDTLGLGHDEDAPQDMNLGTMSAGGIQAEKKRPGPLSIPPLLGILRQVS